MCKNALPEPNETGLYSIGGLSQRATSCLMDH